MNSQQIIEKIDEAQNQIALEPNKNNLKEFFIDGKMAFSIKQQTSKILIFIEFILLSLVTVHIILTQSLIFTRQNNSLKQLIQIFYQNSSFYRIIYTLMIVQKLFLITSIFLQIKQNKYVVGVTWINKKIFKSFGILKQLDLCLTAFLSIVSFKQNVGFFVVSCFIYMFHAIYIQNYVIRKEIRYVLSFSNYLAFRCLVMLSYTADIIFQRTQNFTVFNYFYTIMAFVVFLWYFKGGHSIFYHELLRKIYLTVMALILTIYLKCFENIILNHQDQFDITQISKLIMVFLTIIFVFSFLLNTVTHRQLSLLHFSAKEIDLSLSKLLESSLSNPDLEAQLIGLLYFQFNKNDQSNDFYDPLNRWLVKNEDKYTQKQSTLKQFISNIYKSRIQSQEIEKSCDIYIDYCQFLCNYNHHYFDICQNLNIAKNYHLNIFQRIKIDRIQSMVKQSNQKLNLLIYEGQLQLEHIIDSEECFSIIERKIKEYINGYILIWSLLKNQQISLLQFRLLLKRQFRIIDQLNLRWKKIMKFFEVNKKWGFIYIYFQYFIKNQRIKQKQSDIFRSMKMQNQNIFENHPIYFVQNAKEVQLLNPLILYNDDACSIQSEYVLGSLIIKDVNRRFQAILGYCKQEVYNSSLTVIMEDDLKQVHQQKFNEWVQKGYVSNQNSYNVKRTHVITKQLIKVPAFKYFKSVVSIDGRLIFYCLIKINLKLSNISQGIIISQSQLVKTSHSISSRQVVTEARVKNHFPSTSLDEHIEKNIFIKQQLLQPLQQFQEIKYFKWASRIFLVLMITSILTLLIITGSNGSKLTDYSNQFINYLSMYRFPVILATNYMKSFLNVGNMTKVNQQIQSATNNFLTNANLALTKITMFDSSLNPPNLYYPYYNYPFLNNKSYSQIDLFFMMSSSISTLNKLPVNQTGPQFQRFNSYLKPSYDNMMNTTKFLLHSRFADIFIYCIHNQFLFSIMQSIITCIFIIILFNCIHKFISKMRAILYIILDLNPNQIHAIHSYWKYQREHFNILFLQFQEEQGSKKLLSSENIIKKLSNIKIENDKISLNNRSKQINEDRQRRYFQFKLRAILILLMIAILVITATIQINMIVQLKDLQIFEEAGFFFLKFFPTGPLVTMGCTQKYYSDLFPNQIPFRPAKYDDVLSSMYIFGHNNNYIGEIIDPSSSYYIKQKNYFFGNPCQFNPSILKYAGITVSKCQSMSNGTFKEGLSSFLRYGQKLGQNCIYNSVNLTAAQLDEFTLGGTVLSAYVLDAITTWVTQFASRVLILQNANYVQCIIIILSIVAIHIVANELKLIKIIYQQYEFIKKVYLNLVPQGVLHNEKVIKQKFIIAGLIRP